MGNSCCCCVAVREAVSKKKKRTILKYKDDLKATVPEGGVNLDLIAVHHRIIAMGFPSVGFEALYRNPHADVKAYLDLNYGTNYMVYNLCAEEQHQYPADRFDGRVMCFPFLDHHPCKLSVIPDFIEHATAFLRQSPACVVAIHCKAGKGRTGLMCCCLMMELDRVLHANADGAVVAYGEARTKDGKGLTHRSQIRYVKYWAMLQRDYGGKYPAGGGPVVELRSLMIYDILTTVKGIRAVVIELADGSEMCFVDGEGGCKYEKMKDGSIRIQTFRADPKGFAVQDSVPPQQCRVLLKDDFRVEFRDAPKGKCLGAVSAHTLFLETLYHYSVIDKLYKRTDLSENARLELEVS